MAEKQMRVTRRTKPAGKTPKLKPVNQNGDETFESMNRNGLNKECKKRGIPCKGSNDDKRAAIQAYILRERSSASGQARSRVTKKSRKVARRAAISPVPSTTFRFNFSQMKMPELREECFKRGVQPNPHRSTTMRRLRDYDRNNPQEPAPDHPTGSGVESGAGEHEAPPTQEESSTSVPQDQESYTPPGSPPERPSEQDAKEQQSRRRDAARRRSPKPTSKDRRSTRSDTTRGKSTTPTPKGQQSPKTNSRARTSPIRNSKDRTSPNTDGRSRRAPKRNASQRRQVQVPPTETSAQGLSQGKADEKMTERQAGTNATQILQNIQECTEMQDLVVVGPVGDIFPAVKMRQHRVIGDGNCMLRAFARAFYGSEELCHRVRGELRHWWNFIMNHQDEECQLVDTRSYLYLLLNGIAEETARNLEAQIMISRTYGDEALLQVLADLYNVEILAYWREIDGWGVNVRGNFGRQQIHLANYHAMAEGQGHWAALERLEGNRAIALTGHIEFERRKESDRGGRPSVRELIVPGFAGHRPLPVERSVRLRFIGESTVEESTTALVPRNFQPDVDNPDDNPEVVSGPDTPPENPRVSPRLSLGGAGSTRDASSRSYTPNSGKGAAEKSGPRPDRTSSVQQIAKKRKAQDADEGPLKSPRTSQETKELSRSLTASQATSQIGNTDLPPSRVGSPWLYGSRSQRRQSESSSSDGDTRMRRSPRPPPSSRLNTPSPFLREPQQLTQSHTDDAVALDLPNVERVTITRQASPREPPFSSRPRHRSPNDTFDPWSKPSGRRSSSTGSGVSPKTKKPPSKKSKKKAPATLRKSSTLLSKGNSGPKKSGSSRKKKNVRFPDDPAKPPPKGKAPDQTRRSSGKETELGSSGSSSSSAGNTRSSQPPGGAAGSRRPGGGTGGAAGGSIGMGISVGGRILGN